MGFFDLVEEHHREWLAPNGFGELPTLFVAHIAGGRTHQTTDRVLLHVLRHVQADHCGFVAEQELGECLCKLCLAYAGWAQEDERTRRTLGVFEPGACAANCLRHSLDGLLLADDSTVQFILHAQQLGGLFLGELINGNSRPERQHLGDCLFVNLIEQVDSSSLHLYIFGFFVGQEVFLSVAQKPCCFKVLRLNSLFLLTHDIGEFILDLSVVGRGFHAPNAKPRSGLVNQVDCLIGQEAIRDVTIGHVGGGHESLIGDGDPVMLLVALTQALEDFDCVSNGGLINNNLLETTLKCSVLL